MLNQSSIYDALSNIDNFDKKYSNGLVVLACDKYEAQKLSDVATFLGFSAFVLPDFRVVFGEDLRTYKDELSEILSTLKRFYNAKSKKILFSPLQSLLCNYPKKELLDGFFIQVGDILDLSDLKNKLFLFGYEFVDLVEVDKEVSVRGDIIDIFLPNYENPLRISLFDNEVESLKFFDVNSQMSIGQEVKNIEISPAFFNLTTEIYEELIEAISSKIKTDSIFSNNDLIASYGLWYLKDSINIINSYPFILGSEVKVLAKELHEFSDQNNAVLDNVLASCELLDSQNYEDFEYSFNNVLQFLEFHKNKKITIIAKTEAQVRQTGISLQENYDFILDSELGIWILGKDEVILSLNSTTKQKKKRQSKILLDELKSGDYVVHIDYGVAIFSGLVCANIFGAKRDFIELRYQGEDKLLLPVENLDRIDRYISDGGIPILDRLGKGSFAKLKEKVKEKLFLIANEIISLAAKRELIDGIKIDTNKEEILIFQSKSGFVYTDDQSNAIKEIFNDISSARVMDRLLSGDVGFGKTEVAMNAMFATYLSGYQSAIIAPTTLLAYQHFNTIADRFREFGIRVARLDRYVSTKKKKTTLEGLANGSIDVVVGTHAIFSASFKNLALIVVDEEHKFGVKQKEKIKEISKDTHLLTMSATPIPRTLNMALSKIKSLSELKISPKDRLPIRTFIKEYSSALLKEVLFREFRRNGQVFYIHNNISSIENKKEEILQIVPNAKIAILHSQISANDSENIIMDFANGKYQILLCTSIVESGIHLPNTNTIIVDRSDCFGIADLHQLRGRVGRGNKEGFCYFLVEDFTKITQEAQKRLFALERNSYLGSGGALAYHDLEIRGGGNLLGEAQSGHIKNIGYSLYLRMLEEAIYTLSGNVKEEKANVDVKLSVTAFLNAELIDTERIRLEIYRRLSRCETIDEVYLIEREIEERFGKLDIYTRQFIELILIKIEARNHGISSILNYGQNITFVKNNGNKESISASSKDEDDILKCVFDYFKNLKKAK